MSRRAVFGEFQETRKHRPDDWRWSAFMIVLNTNKYILGTYEEKRAQSREFVKAVDLALRGPETQRSMRPPNGQLPEMRFLALVKNPKEQYIDTDEVPYEDDAIIRPPLPHHRRERAPKRHPDQRKQFFLDTDHELFWPDTIQCSNFKYRTEANPTIEGQKRNLPGGRFHMHILWVVGHKYYVHVMAHRLQNEINRVLEETESPFRVHYTSVSATIVPYDYYVGWTPERGGDSERVRSTAATLDDMGWPDYGPESREGAVEAAEAMIRGDTRGDQAEMPEDVEGVTGTATQTAVRSLFDDLGIVHATDKRDEPYLYYDLSDKVMLLPRRGGELDENVTPEVVDAVVRNPPWVRPDESLEQYRAWREENPDADVQDFIMRYAQVREWAERLEGRRLLEIQAAQARMVNDPLASLFSSNVAGERDLNDMSRPPSPEAPQP